MKIAIDASCTRGKRAGIAWYAINLLSELARIDNDNSYLLYTFYSRAPEFGLEREGLPTGRNVQLKESRIPYRAARFLLDRLGMPIESIIGPFDLLHGLDQSAPSLRAGRLVITIHDLAFLIYPELGYTSPEFAGHGIARLRNLAHRADMIIAVSHHTKHDVESVLGVPEHKIRVVYEAAEKRFMPIQGAEDASVVRRKYRLPERFILFVGTIEPRKNIPLLLRSYHALKQSRRLDHKLVLAGKLGWSYDNVFAVLKELRLQADVVFLGHIPREDLPALYGAADLFVYPSAYEGFGLPPLEAMACGTPVIASRNSCFPEILGEAAILIDPEDGFALSENMYQLLSDSWLSERYAELGVRRAAQFSWERAAQETLQVYREVCRS